MGTRPPARINKSSSVVVFLPKYSKRTAELEEIEPLKRGRVYHAEMILANRIQKVNIAAHGVSDMRRCTEAGMQPSTPAITRGPSSRVSAIGSTLSRVCQIEPE